MAGFEFALTTSGLVLAFYLGRRGSPAPIGRKRRLARRREVAGLSFARPLIPETRAPHSFPYVSAVNQSLSLIPPRWGLSPATHSAGFCYAA